MDRVKRAVIALVALAVLVLRVLPISDPDYHWHLATGRYVVQHGLVPAVDPFSHTAFGARWLFVDWVADVMMYGVARVAGDVGNQILFAALGALGVALAAERARIRVPRATPTMLLAVSLGVAAVLTFRITPRPQTALFPLLGALYLALDAVETSPRARWLLPLVIAVWQNFHSSAVLGVMVIAAYAVGAVVHKRNARMWCVMTGGSAAALLVTVRPIARLRAGFVHLGDARVAELFPEWGSPFRSGVMGAWVTAALILMLLAAIAAAARVGSIGDWLSLVALFVFGVVSARFLPLAAIAAAPLALEGLMLMGERLRVRPVSVIASLLAILAMKERARRPGLGLAPDAFPVHAAEFLRSHDLRGKLFNDFHFGGYLIWTLGDRNPVFVDGRSMAVYDVQFVRDAALSLDKDLEVLLDRYQTSIVVIPPDRRMGALQRRPGWALIFFDDAGAVLVREADVPAAVPFAYRALAPGRWFDIDGLNAEPGRLALAEVEVARARKEAPESSQVAVLEVAVALAAYDYPRAEAALLEAERRFPDVQRVARARLIFCMGRRDAACACATARRINREFPSNSYAGSALIIMACQ
jgi:hypothetical protein